MSAQSTLTMLVALLFCSGACRGSERATPPATATAKSTLTQHQDQARIFTGMCDASAAVALSATSAIVADDEENVLRVYDVDRGGSATSSVELARTLSLPGKPRKDGSISSRELDIEAAARLGGDAYFITSHGRDSKGRVRAERLKFFALRPEQSGAWGLYGKAYEGLLEDLLGEPRLARFELSAAAELPPKAPGGLNIEGMAPRVEGGVWLGFRNPLPQGRALLVPLLNPQAMVLGAKTEFGDPLLLDLGGRGVRALGYWRGRYLIVAGAFDGSSAAALFSWDGAGAVRALPAPTINEYNPEALLANDERDEILLLSDDGSQLIDGVECKKLKDPLRRRFRGLRLKLDD